MKAHVPSVPLEFIGKMNRDLIRPLWHKHREPLVTPGVVQMPCAEDCHERFHEGVHAQPEQAGHQHFPEPHHGHVEMASLEHAERRQ